MNILNSQIYSFDFIYLFRLSRLDGRSNSAGLRWLSRGFPPPGTLDSVNKKKMTYSQWYLQEAGRGFEVSDVQAEVVNALHWAIPIPQYSVTVEVRGGEVTLRGMVERSHQRSYAEAIVRLVTGVTGVHNEISVRADN